jgi:hypothetical protein
MSVTIPDLLYAKQMDYRLWNILKHMANFLLPPEQPPPPPVTGINVQSLGNGNLDVTLVDSGAVNRGVNYFVEHADNPNFINPRIEDFGTSRTKVFHIGSNSRYVRAYSAYSNPHSTANTPTNFGGPAPTLVSAGGAATPVLQASTGSGTASTSGQQGGQGFGTQKQRVVKFARPLIPFIR